MNWLGTTTNATPTEILQENGSRTVIPTDAAYRIGGTAIARSAAGVVQEWSFIAVINNVSGTVSFVVVPLMSETTPGTWTLSLVADDTLKAFTPIFTGASGTTISINIKGDIDAIGAISVPPAPTGLTGTRTSAHVALTWDTSTDPLVSSYNIYRNGVLYDSSATNSYTDSSVSVNVSYTYHVTAINPTGESDQSNSFFTSASGTGSVSLYPIGSDTDAEVELALTANPLFNSLDSATQIACKNAAQKDIANMCNTKLLGDYAIDNLVHPSALVVIKNPQPIS